jgi:hypothetical protein
MKWRIIRNEVPQITTELNEALYFTRGRGQLDIQHNVVEPPKHLQYRPHPHGTATQEPD